MRPTKVAASFGYTVNLGNYESARMDISLETELSVGDNPEVEANKLHEQAKGYVRKFVLQQRKEGPIR